MEGASEMISESFERRLVRLIGEGKMRLELGPGRRTLVCLCCGQKREYKDYHIEWMKEKGLWPQEKAE